MGLLSVVLALIMMKQGRMSEGMTKLYLCVGVITLISIFDQLLYVKSGCIEFLCFIIVFPSLMLPEHLWSCLGRLKLSRDG